MKIIIITILSPLIISSVSAQVTTDILNTGSKSQSFITVQGAAINSIGEFKEAWDKGSAFYVGYGMLDSDNWALMFETGYISFQHNEEEHYSGDPKFTIVPLAIGGRYYFVTDIFRPFLLAMGGINFISQNYTLDEETVEESSTQLHFQVGVGLGILLFNKLEIEGQAKYNCHVLEPSLPYNVTGLEYGFALNWHL
jgi:hypothetical protein